MTIKFKELTILGDLWGVQREHAHDDAWPSLRPLETVSPFSHGVPPNEGSLMIRQRLFQITRFASTALLSFVITSTAFAGTISTPVLFNSGDGSVVCIATNVSSSMRDVTVDLYIRPTSDPTITDVITDTCSSLASNDVLGCRVFANNVQALEAFCKISTDGTDNQVQRHLRGVLLHQDATFPFPTTAAVEAH